MDKRHPIQPLEKDRHGTIRFKANGIVQFLLYTSNHGLTSIATKDFSQENHEQFAQLIGYSLGEFGELSYVNDETYEAASLMAQNDDVDERDALIETLQTKIDHLRSTLREPMAELFGVHPDDLTKK